MVQCFTKSLKACTRAYSPLEKSECDVRYTALASDLEAYLLTSRAECIPHHVQIQRRAPEGAGAGVATHWAADVRPGAS